MSGNEFFYIDADGKKQDAALHEPILAGDPPAATEVGKEVARRLGISEDMILKLYAEPRPPDRSFAAVVVDLAHRYAPTMRRPPAVAFVGLAAQLCDIARQHRLDRRGPSPQAQPIEAPLEVLKSLDNQWRQRQRPRPQRRPLVHVLECDILRHGVDLLALGLRFATSSLAAWGDRRLPPYFNSGRDIPWLFAKLISVLCSAVLGATPYIF